MKDFYYCDEKGDFYKTNNLGCSMLIANKESLTMVAPVKCNHCGQIYDLTDVKVNHRYADCDQFTTPCCNTYADTREYKCFNDFERIDLNEIQK